MPAHTQVVVSMEVMGSCYDLGQQGQIQVSSLDANINKDDGNGHAHRRVPVTCFVVQTLSVVIFKYWSFYTKEHASL